MPASPVRGRGRPPIPRPVAGGSYWVLSTKTEVRFILFRRHGNWSPKVLEGSPDSFPSPVSATPVGALRVTEGIPKRTLESNEGMSKTAGRVREAISGANSSGVSRATPKADVSMTVSCHPREVSDYGHWTSGGLHRRKAKTPGWGKIPQRRVGPPERREPVCNLSRTAGCDGVGNPLRLRQRYGDRGGFSPTPRFRRRTTGRRGRR